MFEAALATIQPNFPLESCKAIPGSAMRLVPAAYRFGMAPYMVNFWKCMAELRPKAFDTVNHLRTAVWGLVNKAPWAKKVGKVFLVVCHHLKVTPPESAQAVIDIITANSPYPGKINNFIILDPKGSGKEGPHRGSDTF